MDHIGPAFDLACRDLRGACPSCGGGSPSPLCACLSSRTFVVGDIHGDLAALRALVTKMPKLEEADTLVFLGDYLDRGPSSSGVIEVVRGIQRNAGFKVVCLRGNHEDAWLRVLDRRWDEFVFPPSNGCLATMRSYHRRPDPTDMWAGECVVAIDTGAGKGGFLTAIELPALRVWESR